MNPAANVRLETFMCPRCSARLQALARSEVTCRCGSAMKRLSNPQTATGDRLKLAGVEGQLSLFDNK